MLDGLLGLDGLVLGVLVFAGRLFPHAGLELLRFTLDSEGLFGSTTFVLIAASVLFI